jgi:hypothetical protein
MDSVTGSNVFPFSSVSAKMKSPQPLRNPNRATVMIAERLIGSTTRVNVCHSLAPSTRAAAMTSRGSASMNARSTRMPNGTA